MRRGHPIEKEPRCYIDGIEILPKTKMDGSIVKDLWVVPGGRVRDTKWLRRLALDNGLTFSITK